MHVGAAALVVDDRRSRTKGSIRLVAFSPRLHRVGKEETGISKRQRHDVTARDPSQSSGSSALSVTRSIERGM